MKKRKVYPVLAGVVTVLFTTSLFLRHQVQGDSDSSLLIPKEQSEAMNKNITSYNISNKEFLGLILRNHFSDTEFLKNQSQKELETSEIGDLEGKGEVPTLEEVMKNNDIKTFYKIVTGKVSTQKEYLPEMVYQIDKSLLNSRRVQLPVTYLSQYPELPTGCEVTSLTTVLNYLGYKVSKETMADNYLPKCNFSDGTFWDYFIGNPRDDDAFGCYATPIVTAHDDFVQWIAPEHCVVMIGYDLDQNTVTLSDPLQGIITVDLDTANTRYRQMCSQAVVIKSNNLSTSNQEVGTIEATKEVGTIEETKEVETQNSEILTEGTKESSTESTTKESVHYQTNDATETTTQNIIE